MSYKLLLQKIISKIKYKIKEFEWLKIYFTPFKPIIPKLYIGVVAIGTPHFLPRKWVKATPKRAIKESKIHIRNLREFNKRNPTYKKSEKPFREVYDAKMKCSFSEPKRIGFDFVELGWKTKFDDYRHEFNPVWSFVFLNYQIALMFVPNDTHYWECYLYYKYETNKNNTPKERVEQAKIEYPCVWNRYIDGEKETICYWDLILKNRYKT